MTIKTIFKIAVFAGLFSPASLNAQINPAYNKMAVDVSTYHVQNPAYNYDSSFLIGKDLGMNEVGLFINWTMLEITPGMFDFTILDMANAYYPAHSMAVDINLNPINTNRLEVPSDLDSIAFDNPVFISRYKTLLDSVKVHLTDLSISSLVIGTEIGAFLQNDSVKWNQYINFYNSVSAYAKTIWPGLKVAVELQFTDLIDYNSFAQQINAGSDYIGVSYYPIWGNYTVKPVNSITLDMDTLVSLYPAKPICFYQFGFPSSQTCNSSDSLQAEFIKQAFTSWDYYASHIRLIDFTWMTDLDTTAVNYYGTYYGVSDTVFLEFLRTLGLRTWNGNGTDKPALYELRCQAKQRNYNNLNISCTTTVTKPNENINDWFSVYPNPVQTRLNIEMPPGIMVTNLGIYNNLGQIEVYYSNLNSNKFSIENLNLINGLYYVVVQIGEKLVTRKFVTGM
ncbi:MAG: T9SS type A sorting domain-containing protein [Bacteroidia bacterium]|nr:T9SS type A sorting domain-containing protein [Bacteroidia bacterium]